MSMTPDKRRFLVQMLGEAETARLERELSALAKTLHEHGIVWKQVLEQPQRADDGVVSALKQSRHPASAYLVDLIERRVR